MLREGSGPSPKTPRKTSPIGSPKNGGRRSGKTPKARRIQEKMEKIHNLAERCTEFPNLDVSDVDLDRSFDCHRDINSRMAKTLYFADMLPSTPRPSLPLTALAVKSYTEFLGNPDTLDFLDLEMASEIGRNACVTPTALIMALIYLERLSANNPSYMHDVKPSELFVVSLLVASKFTQDDGEDFGIYNDEWAASSNIPLKDLNKLEIQFLMALNWNVNMNTKEFMDALGTVERKLALCQGLQRGWFSYTELDTLFSTYFKWNTFGPIILEYVVKLVAAASLTYTALLVAMLSSSLVGPRIFGITQSLLLSTAFKCSQYSYLSLSANTIQPQCSSNMSISCLPLDSRGLDLDLDLDQDQEDAQVLEPRLPIDMDMEETAFISRSRYHGKPSYSNSADAISYSIKDSVYQLFNFRRIFEDLNAGGASSDEVESRNTNYSWKILGVSDFAPPLRYPPRALKCNKLFIM